jgi:hypothetical protein
MLILLFLVVYIVLGVPFVAWLAHRLAQAGREHTDATAVEPLSRQAPEAMPG